MNIRKHRPVSMVAVLLALFVGGGCASDEKKDRDFFTSGSREADQRAEQRVAKVQQLRGESGDEDSNSRNVKKPLFDRLGGEKGVRLIVDDFVARVLADPRVNWERKGVKQSRWLGLRTRSMQWNPDPGRVENLKKHLAEFLALATGGPSQYTGRDMREVHRGLRISNAEFDASVGDLKSTLDKLGVPTEEQKELLSIIESARPQVVELR